MKHDPGISVTHGSVPLRDLPGAITRGIPWPIAACRFERSRN
ncbi:MAG TPA: hypothetical protein VLA67_10535 [Nitrospiraceae bacterium]|nr:hypothetical protein [Nitrospiraceae bacterium]